MIESGEHASEDSASGVADASHRHPVRRTHLYLPELCHRGLRFRTLLVGGIDAVAVVIPVVVVVVGHENWRGEECLKMIKKKFN